VLGGDCIHKVLGLDCIIKRIFTNRTKDVPQAALTTRALTGNFISIRSIRECGQHGPAVETYCDEGEEVKIGERRRPGEDSP